MHKIFHWSKRANKESEFFLKKHVSSNFHYNLASLGNSIIIHSKPNAENVYIYQAAHQSVFICISFGGAWIRAGAKNIAFII